LFRELGRTALAAHGGRSDDKVPMAE
jgi:hypothetical protein